MISSAMENIQSNNIENSCLYLDWPFFLSQSESQGIALAEAWAMDVPTFSWNPGEFVYKMHTFKNVSSAPYTTSENGALWKDIDELYCVLDLFLKENTYSPRKWILNNITDILCSKQLLSLIYNNPCNKQ